MKAKGSSSRQSKEEISEQGLRMWWKRFIEREAGIVLTSPWRGSILRWLKFDDYTVCNSHPDRIAAYRTLLEMGIPETDSEDHLGNWFATIDDTASPESEKKRAADNIFNWMKALRDTARSAEQLQQWKTRFDDYEARRELASERLNRILLPDSIKTTLRSDVPKKYVPHHTFMGRLHGFRLIAKDSLASFFDAENGDFWRCSRAQQTEFFDAYYEAKAATTPGGSKHAIFGAWVEDNMPVFQRFCWDWKSISIHAEKAGFKDGRDIPKDLARWASDHNRSFRGEATGAKWKLNTRSKRADPKQIARTAQLLTPRPQIATLLHPESIQNS